MLSGRRGEELPRYHPLTPLRRFEDGTPFRLVHALSNTLFTGANGSGKTSSSEFLALGLAAAGAGILALCSKADEADRWQDYARKTGREKDLIIVDDKGSWRFNFLNWEAMRESEGGGMTINVVALLDELAHALAGGSGQIQGGDSKFWEGSLHHLNTNLVDLSLLAGLGVSLPVLRAILLSAPQSLEQAESEEWQIKSDCYKALVRADRRTASADEDTRADFDECKAYWLKVYPTLSERTRSIVDLMFSMLVRPFVTRPLRRLFSSDTNVRPEDTFNGKIIIVNLPLQTHKLVGRAAAMAWKYTFQVAALRRTQPANGPYLRPVCLWVDEYANFISPFDFIFASLCRSAAACMVALVQNRELMLSVLKSDAMVDSLCANMSNKFFCQNTGATNAWASRLIGHRWTRVEGVSANRSPGVDDRASFSAGVNFHDELRPYVDEAVFSHLRRGGPANDLKVDCVVHMGGQIFGDGLPYKLVTFNQR